MGQNLFLLAKQKGTPVFLQPYRFPLLIDKTNKNIFGIFLAVIASALYLLSNHFHFFNPQLMHLSIVDVRIPFLPYTVWIYVSEYLFFVSVYCSCQNILNLNKYFYSFLSLQTVSVFIFWLWPTTYPRELFPLPENLEKITYFIFDSLRKTDSPANCCPSLHVSSVYLSSFMFLNEQKHKFPMFFLWGTGIALSTLTTKQHYLIDVVVGFLMSLLTFFIFQRFVHFSEHSDTE